MKTVDKAMTVLNQFSIDRTELGLSELARLAELDKAATRRLLVALARHGYIEQSTESRKYRLGSGFLGLARVREATVPLAKAAQETCNWLTEATDETTHISVPMSEYMSTIAYALPRRGNIINIIPAQPLPFHATATGYAYLATATDSALKTALGVKRERHTKHTLVRRTDVLSTVAATRDRGYAQCSNLFEDGVTSIAMAFFADSVEPIGTISIAVPGDRLNDDRVQTLLTRLRSAIARVEAAITGASQPHS